ncbi:MAG TPA: hypothetical protein VJN64_04655 [Terriglobales bacterium]|nr:hypothetical protein [Terriglobales bacterium]
MSYAQDLPATETRRSFIVAAIAADEGSESALKKSLELTTDEDDRNKVLVNAGSFLLQIQNYAQAAELFEAAARGESNGAQLSNLVSMLKKTKPRAELKLDAADPAGVVQQLFAGMLSSDPSLEKVEALVIKPVRESMVDPKREQQDFRRGMFDFRNQMESSGLPLQAIGDMVLSNIRYTKEGDDNAGYRVTMIIPGAAPQDVFVAREDGVYKIV